MLSKHFLGDLIISNLIFGSYWPSFLSCPGLNVSHVFWVFWSLPANVSGFIPGTNTSRPPWYSQLCPPSKGGSSLSPTQPGPISLQWFGLGRGTWFPSLSLSPLLFLLHRVACKEKVKERRSRKFLSDGSSMTWHLHFHTCLLFSHSVVSDFFVIPWKPNQLLCSWDFSEKHTNVGCCFLLQGILCTWQEFKPKSASSFRQDWTLGLPWMSSHIWSTSKAHILCY